MAEEMFLTQKA
jgi:hypothetical protein